MIDIDILKAKLDAQGASYFIGVVTPDKEVITEVNTDFVKLHQILCAVFRSREDLKTLGIIAGNLIKNVK
jgi:hypothetical protein